MFNKYQNKNQRDFIEKELDKIFKLRIAIYRKTTDGKLERVSEIKDTDLIKESKFIKTELFGKSQVLN
jgi:hypothetical protein